MLLILYVATKSDIVRFYFSYVYWSYAL